MARRRSRRFWTAGRRTPARQPRGTGSSSAPEGLPREERSVRNAALSSGRWPRRGRTGRAGPLAEAVGRRGGRAAACGAATPVASVAGRRRGVDPDRPRPRGDRDRLRDSPIAGHGQRSGRQASRHARADPRRRRSTSGLEAGLPADSRRSARRNERAAGLDWWRRAAASRRSLWRRASPSLCWRSGSSSTSGPLQDPSSSPLWLRRERSDGASRVCDRADRRPGRPPPLLLGAAHRRRPRRCVFPRRARRGRRDSEHGRGRRGEGPEVLGRCEA